MQRTWTSKGRCHSSVYRRITSTPKLPRLCRSYCGRETTSDSSNSPRTGTCDRGVPERLRSDRAESALQTHLGPALVQKSKKLNRAINNGCSIFLYIKT